MAEKTYAQMKTEYIAFCNKYIKPYLPKYEKMRKEKAGTAIWIFVFNICLIITIISGSLRNINLCVIFCIITLIPVFILKQKNLDTKKPTIISNFENDMKKKFMKPVLSIFSQNSNWKKGNCWWDESIYFLPKNKSTEYRTLNIFNPYPWILFDDLIFLEHKNVNINIFEMNTIFADNFLIFAIVILPFLICLCKFYPIHVICSILSIIFLILLIISLKNGAIHANYYPFRGIVIELNMNKNFSGHTFFHEKSKISKKIPFDKNEYEPVNLESVDFTEKYNVFSTDQVEARYLLTTSMIERINNLKLAFSANYIRGSFKDNKFIIAIDTGKDMFAMGSDYKESDAQTFTDLFNEIVSVMKIVDQLKLNEKTGL